MADRVWNWSKDQARLLQNVIPRSPALTSKLKSKGEKTGHPLSCITYLAEKEQTLTCSAA